MLDSTFRKSFNPDTTYKSNWKRFKLFVDEHRDNQSGLVDDGLYYITRSNVDLFFANVISTSPFGTRHAKRFASALQKYSDCYEHISEKFVVKSDDVKESLDAQKIF